MSFDNLAPADERLWWQAILAAFFEDLLTHGHAVGVIDGAVLVVPPLDTDTADGLQAALALTPKISNPRSRRRRGAA